MQSSIGNRRRYESSNRAGVLTSSSIKIISFAALLTLISSCSHSQKKTQIKPFESLCLSGEGKGRIERLKGRYVFAYENLFKRKEKEWLLALSMPMHGEEVLTLGFGGADKSKVQVKGKFFKRMVYAARKEKKVKEIKQLRKVLGKIGVFLKVVDLVRIGDQPCKDGVCSLNGKHDFKYKESQDELNATFIFDKNHDFLVNARSNSSYYRKIKFTLQDKRRSSNARQPFSLSLIHRECSRPL